MNLRARIESTFGERVFERPLVAAFPGGLRFELSEGGTAIRQLFVALRKAEEILFSLGKRLWLWPYDDRGMDVVGPNREALRLLRDQFQGYLLRSGGPKGAR